MKDLNVRQESIKILEENTGSNVFDLGHGNFFLDTSPRARGIRAKMNYWDFVKIKSFCTAKETVNKTKRQTTEWEKIFANDISDKGRMSKIYKDGGPGWLSHYVSAFSSGHEPRVLGSSPTWGSLLSRKPAFPSHTPLACVPSCAVYLCQINK